MRYKSHRNYFAFELPKDWYSDYSDNVYSFFNDSIQGVFQISVFESDKIIFNLEEEFVTEKSNYKTAEIIKIGRNKFIHYGIYLSDNEAFRYDWIIGKGHIKLYITFLLNQNESEVILDKNYNEVVKILYTLSIGVSSDEENPT